MDTKELIVNSLKEKFGKAVEEISDFRNDLCITVEKDKLIDATKFLKENPKIAKEIDQKIRKVSREGSKEEIIA